MLAYLELYQKNDIIHNTQNQFAKHLQQVANANKACVQLAAENNMSIVNNMRAAKPEKFNRYNELSWLKSIVAIF